MNRSRVEKFPNLVNSLSIASLILLLRFSLQNPIWNEKLFPKREGKVAAWLFGVLLKIALKIDKNNNEEMLCLHRKAENLGLVSVPVMEESSCMKNITVLGIGPGSEELVNEVTGHLKLL
nr:probable peptidyl-tRNA hydrolase 2 isoform X1 [Halyomorpha halys]